MLASYNYELVIQFFMWYCFLSGDGRIHPNASLHGAKLPGNKRFLPSCDLQQNKKDVSPPTLSCFVVDLVYKNFCLGLSFIVKDRLS